MAHSNPHKDSGHSDSVPLKTPSDDEEESFNRYIILADESDPAKGGICQTIYPGGFREECKQLCKLAVPTILSVFFTIALGPVSLMFCGHLSREELDGVALAISMLNITGISVGFGLTSACDTFFAQGFGSNNKKIVGVYLQRSILVTSLGTIPFLCFNLNAESLLVLLGQDKDISRIAGRYMLCFMPALLFNVWMNIAMKFMITQNVVIPTLIIGAIGNGCNLLAHYVVMQVFHFRTESSAWCQVLSYFVMTVASVTYILVTGFHKPTWDGFSWKALQDWGEFFRMAAGGLVMLAAEWWMLEIGIWLNGLVGKLQLAATAVTFQLLDFVTVMTIGLSQSATIRVGQHLGSGSAVDAKNAYRVSLTLSLLGFLVNSTLALSLKDYLPRLFSNDSEVIEMTAKNIPLVCAFMFFDAFSLLSGGVVRGCGRQWTGAAIIGACYSLLVLPISAIFIFVAKLGSIGN